MELNTNNLTAQEIFRRIGSYSMLLHHRSWLGPLKNNLLDVVAVPPSASRGLIGPFANSPFSCSDNQTRLALGAPHTAVLSSSFKLVALFGSFKIPGRLCRQ